MPEPFEHTDRHPAALAVGIIPQPLAHRSQTLPPHTLVALAHEIHDPRLQPVFLQLAPLIRHLPDQIRHIIARNRQHLLVVVPALAHNLGQFLRQRALVVVEDAAGVLGPEGRAAVRGRPAQVAGLDLGRVLVEGGVVARVFVEHAVEVGEVVEEVRVREVAAGEVAEQGGQAGGDGGGEEVAAVGGGEVVEGREEEAGGFFFGREAEELCV
jgi:hypothetical protein